jgi:ribosomal protein S18 acetylase RimI-like enzyme
MRRTGPAGKITSVRSQFEIRPARAVDYDTIVNVADHWWGRPVSASIPRLFLDHFADTSLIATHQGDLVGFLVGFFSPGEATTAYIHFAGVHPDHRGTGMARELYGRFAASARAADRTIIKAITSPANSGSIAFHRALGFTITGPAADYNGPGRPMVLFELSLDSVAPGC